MIVSMSQKSGPQEIDCLIEVLERAGLGYGVVRIEERAVIGIHGDPSRVSLSLLRQLPGVDSVTPTSKPATRSAVASHPEPLVQERVAIGDVTVGGGRPVVVAGPCSVESEAQFRESARQVKQAGADILRGGVWKYRSSPYSGWEGIGAGGFRKLAEGLKLSARVAREFGMPLVVEIISVETVSLYEDCGVDAIQIGEPNSRNTALLNRLRETPLPVIHKRGNNLDVEAYLLWVERMMTGGKRNIILCERGVQSANKYTRNTLDIGGIAALRHQLSCLPVMIDASHGTGIRDLVFPTTMAGIAAGAAGAMVEVHPNPLIAKSDGKQSLFIEQFESLVRGVHEAWKTTEALRDLHVKSATIEPRYTERMEADRDRFFETALCSA